MKEKLWMDHLKGNDLYFHHRNLRESKPHVDCSAPQQAQRSRRLEQERERQLKATDYDNRLILERLAKVVQKKIIDNDPVKLKAMTKDPTKKMVARKIRRENHHMLSRLTSAQRTYSVAEWRKQEEWRQGVLANMADPRLRKFRPSSASRSSPQQQPEASSSGYIRPRSAAASMSNRASSQQIRRDKDSWQTAYALCEQDRMHLQSAVPPLLVPSPVFGKIPQTASKPRPKTAGAVSRSAPSSSLNLHQQESTVNLNSFTFNSGNEMKKLFRPVGAHISAKI